MKRSIEQAQKRLADVLMRRNDISGVGVGAHKGEPCLKVYLSGGRAGNGGKTIPDRFEGHPVMVVSSGPFRALDSDD